MTRRYQDLGKASDWLQIDSANQKHYPDLGSDASSVSETSKSFIFEDEDDYEYEI